MKILVGDALAVLRTLEPESVQCVVTSPPYWGMRDYGQDAQIGLEPTPELYVAKMVEVFREVRRVLCDDGTLWLNLGDSYAGGGNNSGNTKEISEKQGSNRGNRYEPKPVPAGLKPKDLVGIPWRVAFALQADGWYLRSDIIWAKPNPMPESVTDRPTKSHEYVFLLTKSARYFFDQEAVREAPAEYDRKGGTATYTADGFTTNGVGSKSMHQMSAAGGNIRSVWSIATQPFPEAHFATFPEELARRCVKAGTSEKGCCATHGKPWERVTESKPLKDGRLRNRGGRVDGYTSLCGGQKEWNNKEPVRTIGWRPGCAHEGEPVPCVILDPFAGSGTVGVVCAALQRDFVGIELNPAYAEMAQRRIDTVAPLFVRQEATV